MHIHLLQSDPQMNVYADLTRDEEKELSSIVDFDCNELYFYGGSHINDLRSREVARLKFVAERGSSFCLSNAPRSTPTETPTANAARHRNGSEGRS